MDVRITPRSLSGAVTPPPSKSMTHRLLIAAALGGGVSAVENVVLSRDVEATLRSLAALGASWKQSAPGVLQMTGFGGHYTGSDLPRFDCGESGSTLRFLLPVALSTAGGGVFTGRGRLLNRPLEPYFELFDERGVTHALHGGALAVGGTLRSGEYRLPGNVSSQFFTGLLFALPLLDGPSRIVPTSPVESRSYLSLTLDALAAAGVSVSEDPSLSGAFSVSPAVYHPFVRTVEPDWSQAAFWYAANFLNGDVKPEGLHFDSLQGDRVVADLYWKLARPGDTEIDLSDCPDLLAPLAVMAAVRRGETRFTHAARLRFKESDRLRTVTALLRALGCAAEEGPDTLTVRGGELAGGTVDGAGDHRIVMAAAVAACACAGPVLIRGAEAVDKSYPSFWDDYQRLGGDVRVL